MGPRIGDFASTVGRGGTAVTRETTGDALTPEESADNARDLQHPPRRSIVVVDDHLDLRELLGLRLGMIPGADVIGRGSNGNEALDLARALSPDLMTIDLRMPVMNGVEAIPLLRAVAPQMRIILYTSDPDAGDLAVGSRPDMVISKGEDLQLLVDAATTLLAEGPMDLVDVDLGRLSVHIAVAAFDSWIGLHARVREAITTKGDVSADLLGEVPVNASDLFCLMGVFMQFAAPLVIAKAAGEPFIDLRFKVRRDPGAAARRALLALGGNGTLRAFNKAWSHSPSKESADALDLVDSRLAEQLPVS